MTDAQELIGSDHIHRFRAEVMEFASAKRIPLRSLQVVTQVNDWARELCIGLRIFAPAYQWAEQHWVETIPATWWDAVKDRFRWLAWFGLRPHYRQVGSQVRQFRVCPHIERPDYRNHLEWLACGERYENHRD